MGTPTDQAHQVTGDRFPQSVGSESFMQWTAEAPTVCGWYWFRHAIFHGKAGAWHEPLPVVVEVVQDSNGGFNLYVPGTDRVWSFEELIVAELAGPLVPPA